MKRLICYGDSNTYGYDAMDVFGGRLPPDQRWTDLLANALSCEVINCGMNGRTVARYPRSVENDLRLIQRNAPCDLVIVMLGTNDVLTDLEPEETAEAMRRFLILLKKNLPESKILLSSPPKVSGIGEVYNDLLSEVAEAYRALADEVGAYFANAFLWRIALAADGVHFSPEGHRAFSERMKEAVRNVLK